MIPLSYYQATANPSDPTPPVRGAVDAAVCVVGGGFAGLNTALGLAERGVGPVVLLESRELGFGASGRNGGFVFGGFSRGEASLLADLGPTDAAALYRGTREAVALIQKRVQEHGIDCGLQRGGVILANWFRDPSRLRARQTLLREHYATDWQWLPADALRQRVHSTRYHDGLFEPDAAGIHPLNYVRGLARVAREQGVVIHEASPATRLRREGSGWRVDTAEGSVGAAQVVLACGGYLAGLHGAVDRSVMPIATYVMTTEPLGPRLRDCLASDAAVYDTRFAFDYYRPLPDTRLLWGGRISIRDRDPAAVRALLYRDLLRVFPQLEGVRIDHAWSGLMSYARHEMPQVAKVDEGLWVAQAFGGHGVAPTTLAGEWLAEAIAGGRPLPAALQRYPLSHTFRPAGLWAAQLTYWWLQARDAWDDWREQRGG